MPGKTSRARSQNEVILAVLNMGGKLTQMDALKRFGCMRLASRISDLKAAGWPIEKTMITTQGGASVAEYAMGKKQDM